ncbi:MAG: hypothetical protein IID46_09365 [Planctomycetes bacterium]|nr:hypothetical protein [Planctomycetota bacterium]
MKPKALALVLERRFPHLDDRLITSVEIEESTTGRESVLTESMLRRTVDDVMHAAEGLDVADVFDKVPLRRAMIGAAALIVSIAGFSIVMPEAMGYWWAAYVNLEDEYWDRRTEILVHVETRPNSQIKDFRNREGLPTNGRPGEYKHRRGDDLVLFIEVPQKVSRGKFKGDDAVVPEYVNVSYDFTGVRDSDDAEIRIRPGIRHVKFTLSAVTDNVEIFVSGGDFTNRLPYQIVVVDAPRLDEIVLKSDYPAYTGLNRLSQSSPLQDKKVRGLQTTIPAETRFLFHCQVNKPLVNVRLEFGPYELEFGDFLNSPDDSSKRELSFKAWLTTRSLDGGPAERTHLPFEVAGRYLSDDRMSFTVPFVASQGKTEVARQRMEQSFPTYGKPFVLAEDYQMRIYLEDADGIRTVDPTKLMIIAIPDSPPEFIDVEVQGVDRMITHRADIPVRGIIADDYGIAMSRFEFQIDDETESWIPRPFNNPPEEYPKEFKLQRGPDQEFERFSVLPLDLKVGQKLTLTVFAEDDDNLNGPNAGRSKRFPFTIVSPADLLINMYEKELNLKKQFEQIRDEVRETRDVLEIQQERIKEAKELREKGPEPGQEQEHRDRLAAIAKGLSVAAETRLHQVRKNAGETAAVEEAFRSILQELQNNKVPGGDRIKSDVVDPLEGITKDDFPTVDSAVNQFRLDNEKGRDPTAKIDESINETENLLRNMDSVLQGMQDIVEFHQLIKNLETIITEQEAIEQNTADEQKKSLRKRLGGD